MNIRISQFLFAAIILFSLIFESCSKKSDVTTTALPFGTIIGHVILYDQYGAQILTGLKGAKIFIEGQNDTIYSDSTGAYSYSVPSGSYTIDCIDPGYGSDKLVDFQIVSGATTVHDISLSQIPNFTFLTMTAVDSAGLISINFTVPFDARQREGLIFVGRNNVNSTPANYLTYYPQTIKAGVTALNVKIQTQDLLNVGFNDGDSVYFAGYGAAVD